MRFNMNRRLSILLGFAMFCWCGPVSLLHAEVIDKIAAIVDGRIITLSDIRLEHEVEAVLGDPSETNEELLKSMIDRALMEEEMAQYPSLDVSDDEVDERMKAITDFHGVAPAAVRSAIVRKIQRRKYLELRYQQFIVVSNEEIEKEYETIFVPEAVKRGIPVPALKDIEGNLRMILTEKKVSEEVDMSLRDLRARGNVESFY
jgi:hypothetical protein